MARVLIVGCGCRGERLARALIAEGHAVRGTTRREEQRAAIEAAGADAVHADPNRLATLLPHLQGVTVLCWLMGSARDEDDDAAVALHGDRLEALLETLVDTHVRGAVYEAAGTVPDEALARGTEIARRASATYAMPVALLTAPPAEPERWLDEALRAVESVLSA